MKTKIKSLLVLLIASISFISCDSDVEYVEQNTDVVIGAEGTITIGSGGIDYKMKNCKLKKGESLKIDFSKTGSSDVNAVVVRKRLRVYTIVDFSFIRTFAPSF